MARNNHNYICILFIILQNYIQLYVMNKLIKIQLVNYCKNNARDSYDLYWLTFEEELHSTTRPTIFKTSTFERCQADIIKLRKNYCITVKCRNKSGFKLIYYKYWMSLDSWIYIWHKVECRSVCLIWLVVGNEKHTGNWLCCCCSVTGKDW